MTTMVTPEKTTKGSFLAHTEVEKLPNLICLGYVNEFPEPKETESEVYYNIRFSLKGQRGSRDIATNFLFRPDWFVAGFSPTSLKDLVLGDDERFGEKMYRVYRNNILGSAKSRAVTVLGGLAGATPEGLATLDAAIGEAYEAKGAELTPEEIHSVIKHHIFNVVQQPTVGYVLKQKQDKEDDGTYTLAEGYEFGSFFNPTEDAIDAYIKKAKDGKCKLAFERD